MQVVQFGEVYQHAYNNVGRINQTIISYVCISVPRPGRGRKTFMKCEDRYGYGGMTAKEEQTSFRDLRGTTCLIQGYKHFLPWLEHFLPDFTRALQWQNHSQLQDKHGLIRSFYARFQRRWEGMEMGLGGHRRYSVSGPFSFLRLRT